jgi:hypothetical protein
MSANTVLADTYMKFPAGTTAERPSSPTAGMTRINSQTGFIEFYNGTQWTELSIFTPASISGLIGWYDTGSVSGTTWTDKSGSGNNATITGATVTSVSGNGATLLNQALHGTLSSHKVVFNSNILPSANYTLFHVTRTTGAGSRLRIFTSGVTNNGSNWLSGFHSGNTGVAYHDAWITNQSNLHGNNWVLSTDQRSLYRSNGVNRTITGGGSPGFVFPLTINENASELTVGWMCAEVIVYNRILTQAEYETVERYLASRYGLTLG